MSPARSPCPIICRARARQGRPRNQKALRARFLLTAPPLTGAGTTWTWLLELRAGIVQPEFSAILIAIGLWCREARSEVEVEED